ncbi:Hypothetical predicted protein [Mytilus galloprovincialis]|uniref:Farnesoic acid O-methyl transferase domain-containing protein n=1 Tax=Mytilus galloprovincialis TaxID=29158 RepID=A0A8B6DIW0_MYTGA|nr:Hypothetical predicted protein [Mytilus galloprovincialis]
MLPELSQSIRDRIISFKVKTCTNAYVGLISGTDETDPLYEIAIGSFENTQSFIRIGKDYSAPKLSEIAGRVLDCSAYTEFCITWDANTINVRRGMYVTGSLFLSWTSKTEQTTIEPTNDISTAQLTTGDTATPESQPTDLHVSVDSTSFQKANSTGNLQTNITTIQYNSEEVQKADTIKQGMQLHQNLNQRDLHVSVDSTSLQKANSTGNLQTNITTIQNNSVEATTKADRNQTKLTTIEPTNDISTTQLTTGDTATPESQSTDLYVSVDSTALQNANSTGNLQTNITTIQYNSEEVTTKADRNQTSNLLL